MIIFLILIIGILLRFITINQSLWLDEAINVVAAKQYDFFYYVTQYPIGDFHPPGYFALLWLWIKFFGDSEIAVRLPSLIFGVLTIYLTFLIGKNFFNKKIGYIAAFFMAISPLHVYYSQEARMYSFACFAVSLSFYFLFKLLKFNNRRDLGFYILANVLVLYSDYVAYLAIVTQFLVVVIFYREKIKNVFLGLCLSGVSILPWLPIFIEQLNNGQKTAKILVGWSQVVGGASIKNLGLVFVKTFFGRISIDNNLIYGLLSALVGLFYLMLIWLGLRKFKKENLILVFWSLGSLILAFVLSFFIPALAYFRLIFILPAFYLIIGIGVSSLTKKWLILGALSVFIISIVSLITFYLNPLFQREDWKNAVLYIDKLTSENNKVLLINDNLFFPIKYYSINPNGITPALIKIPAQNDQDIVDIDGDQLYVVNYLVDITDPDRVLEKKLYKEGYEVIDSKNFNGVGLIDLYKR